MPARKKPATDAAAPRATSRKKPTTAVGRGAGTRAKAAPAEAPGARPNGTQQDLVIVESPSKAKTIEKYLGPRFKVLASYGHVRDLPERGKATGEAVEGIDIAGGWLPRYVVQDRKDKPGSKFKVRSPKDILADLRREANRSGRVFLATDPDREGEAIAWHIQDELGLDDAKTFRITFNEITRSAVQNALAHPAKIDMERVQAQEARRMLDRVVGYPLSKLLRQKVTRDLSAGRVQSVAVRLVVEREREIEAFKTEEFWRITALLAPAGTVPFEAKPFTVLPAKQRKKGEEGPADADGDEKAAEKADKAALPPVPDGAFRAELAEWAGKKYEAGSGPTAGSETAARAIASILDTAAYTVRSVEQKDRPERPHAPFTTSTLQQQANIRLHFSAHRTMMTAQQLYQGVPLGSEGSIALITYMRTDSTRVSDDALKAVRAHIDATFGSPYLPAKPNVYASGKSAQEAHEAIRPTDLSYSPQRVAQLGLAGDQLRLYTLVYNRFVASQMTPAVFAVTNVEVLATPQTGTDVGVFKAQGKIMKFDGYRRVLAPAGGKQEDALLPALAEKQALDKLDLFASQHYTQPPPRYNEASLVKALEKEGIGRPSTYATIITTIQKRGYVVQEHRRFKATPIGKDVTDLLIAHFPKLMDLKFTSHMEEELDQIETRQMQYRDVLNEFWAPFSESLTLAQSAMPTKRGVETGEKCPKCGKPLVENYSPKTGNKFVGCSGWRKEDGGCRYIKPAEGQPERPEPTETDVKCPNCGKPMAQKFGKRGPFLGCTGYPDCKTTMNIGPDGKPVVTAKPTAHVCPKCGEAMVLREGRLGPFLSCSGYPKCKNAMDCDAHGNPLQPLDAGGILCAKCNAPMIVKPRGIRGPYLACSAYPKCKSTKPLPPELKEKLKDLLPAPPAKKAAGPTVEVEDVCPECGSAMKVRRGAKGPFLGCSKYPKCKGTREASPELLEKLQEAGAT